MRSRNLLVVLTLIMLMAGCTPAPSTTPTPTPTPEITLNAPETAVEKATATVVINSTGHDGETVSLYAFLVSAGQPSTCTDTSVQPMPVTLRGGMQSVDVPTNTPGDIWWMLTGTGVSIGCGQLKTRILASPQAAISFGVDKNGNTVYKNATLDAEQPFTYNVGAMATNGVTITGTVTWIGPFQTAPEANVSPCPLTPVAFTDQVSITEADGDLSQSKKPNVAFTHTITDPGVYRVVLSVNATATTAEWADSCEDAPLVTIQ